MEYAPCISQIATLLADPKRSAMIWALMDGTARAADELALLAGLSTSSAGAHLARLATGGLLKQEARGRKRFFRLAGPEIGAAVEALASASLVSIDRVSKSVSQPVLSTPLPLRRARICADHLGGELAAELYQRLLGAGWIEQQEQRIEVTSKGVAQFAERGIYVPALAHRKRQTVCACPDWSERTPHLGGALGAGLLQLFIQLGWLRTTDESTALQVSSSGQREISKIASAA
ncbi:MULTISPECIES: helix-turn-helix transcriptional regulator [unclassified Pseudomonas]|uniref:ArsR/SmtB family transcription factor n=1 Tax=unclassified Pseudomonas TaxID=196821 RepID=UPI002AC9A04E|nr:MULTISPECIES: helix-turn-helix transcriptional regulator [unclassified Pseudomonas]MEB0043213.1 helix-turn-helix transcriptional regulator [Pseudomonas sp. MH10]MEB0080121.1 helix-turn-helix transcriptional regulator [Pseudomonas sp. MH10out]MEB0094094.1 helix-turn-helix transcriptional regulator [Pseudomonas sp. CCI4.2]MEB0104507.1 helix-turn-helix transcriptional regulator [Pseudomonas sp. CCI3.2]MEB0123434.1 helix-turn-helix transcriptional regulator [Pseudomonas sp. CCI1.2]